MSGWKDARMNVYLIDAREHASYDEHEAWVVIAETPEAAWSLIRNGEYEMPVVREYDGTYRMPVEPGRTITLRDVKVEVLGTSADGPRVAFDAFLRG